MQQLNRTFLLLLALMPFVGYLNEYLTGVYIGYVAGIIAIIISILNLLNQKSEKRFPKYLVFYFLFVLYSIAINYIRELVEDPLQFFGTNSIIYSFFLLFVIENSRMNQRFIKTFILFLKISVVFGIITGTIQLLFDKSFFVNLSGTVGEVSSYMTSDMGRIPNVGSYAGGFGFYLLTFASLLIHMFNKKSTDFGSMRKTWLVIFIVATGYLIIIAQHRWLMVAYLIVLFQFSVYNKNFIGGSARNLIYLAAVVFLVYFVLDTIGYNIDRLIQDRILQTDRGSIEQNTGYSRIIAYAYFADFYPEKNPLFGTGPTLARDIKSVVHSQIHVGWLSLLLYYGLVGGLLFIGCVYLLGRDIYKVARYTGQYFVFFVFLAYIWMNLMQVVIHFLDWGFLLSLVFYKYQKERLLNNKEAEHI